MLLSIESAYAFDDKTVKEPSHAYCVTPVLVSNENRTVRGFLGKEISVTKSTILKGCIDLLVEFNQPGINIRKI